MAQGNPLERLPSHLMIYSNDISAHNIFVKWTRSKSPYLRLKLHLQGFVSMMHIPIPREIVGCNLSVGL